MFTDLHDFVQQQFSAFSGLERYEYQLSIWCVTARLRRAEYDREWRRMHPEKNYSYVRAWRRRRPDLLAAQRKRSAASRRARIPERVAELKREAQKRKRAKRPEFYRELNRKNQAARRARLKAAAQGAPAAGAERKGAA